MNTKLLLSICIFFLGTASFAQEPIKFDLQMTGTTDKNNLVAHSDSSTLPDTLVIKGKIIENYKGICGDLCAGGTAKIELSEKIDGYPYWYVYVITTCYDGEIRNDELEIFATKYLGNEDNCYYKKAIDIIDSKGVAYYKLSEEESLKIAH